MVQFLPDPVSKPNNIHNATNIVLMWYYQVFHKIYWMIIVDMFQ